VAAICANKDVYIKPQIVGPTECRKFPREIPPSNVYPPILDTVDICPCCGDWELFRPLGGKHASRAGGIAPGYGRKSIDKYTFTGVIREKSV